MYHYCQCMLFTQTFKRKSNFYTVGIHQQSWMSVEYHFSATLKYASLFIMVVSRLWPFLGFMTCSLVEGNQEPAPCTSG
jgi:hypothetical protein